MLRIQYVVIAAMLLSAVALAQNIPLPFDSVDSLDGVKFKIRVPANWNGTLLVYMQGSKSVEPPPEPLLVPPVVDAGQPSLEATLLSMGYALAASEVGTADWQIKEEVQDSFALTTYFRAKVGNPKRVILWGSSMGGVTALRMIEDYPRSFDAAIPMCSSGAGWSRRMDRNLDFALAYAVTFGWPQEWGSLGDVRQGLNFMRDVYPNMQLPAAEGINHGKWEFIRLVYGLPSEALYGTCPLYKTPMFLMIMMTSTQLREDSQAWAAGPVAQNRDHYYTLKPEEKAYLAGLGVNADDLLSKMNARTDIVAAPWARTYIERFGDLRGRLRRPVVSLKNTLDGQAEVRHEAAYRNAVEFWGATEYLVQRWVAGVGHCAFTSRQLLLSLAAVENWLDTGVKPDSSFFPEADGFDNAFTPAPWPY